MKLTEDRQREWLSFAQEDLLGAEKMLEEEISNLVCFHSHQCVEKILKTFLVDPENVPPKSHDLEDLRVKVELKGFDFDEFKEEIKWMNRFYIPTRYPEAFVGSLPEGLPTKEDAEKAVEIARKIFEKGKEILES